MRAAKLPSAYAQRHVQVPINVAHVAERDAGVEIVAEIRAADIVDAPAEAAVRAAERGDAVADVERAAVERDVDPAAESDIRARRRDRDRCCRETTGRSKFPKPNTETRPASSGNPEPANAEAGTPTIEIAVSPSRAAATACAPSSVAEPVMMRTDLPAICSVPDCRAERDAVNASAAQHRARRLHRYAAIVDERGDRRMHGAARADVAGEHAQVVHRSVVAFRACRTRRAQPRRRRETLPRGPSSRIPRKRMSSNVPPRSAESTPSG